MQRARQAGASSTEGASPLETHPPTPSATAERAQRRRGRPPPHSPAPLLAASRWLARSLPPPRLSGPSLPPPPPPPPPSPLPAARAEASRQRLPQPPPPRWKPHNMASGRQPPPPRWTPGKKRDGSGLIHGRGGLGAGGGGGRARGGGAVVEWSAAHRRRRPALLLSTHLRAVFDLQFRPRRLYEGLRFKG